MKPVIPACLLLVLGLGVAHAQGLPIGETTYIETQRPRDGTLIIEHPPVPRNPYGRRNGPRAEIAGFCRDAGFVQRYTADGAVIVRQREACDSIAPRTLAPGQSDPRPTWPEPPALRTRG